MTEEQTEAASTLAQRFRLVALDIDGTLLDPVGQITPRTHAAVSALQAAGILVTLATSRRWTPAAPFAAKLSLTEPLILCDGAMIRSHPDGALLLSDLLPAKKAQQAALLLAEAELPAIAQFCDPLNANLEYLIADERPPHPEWLTEYLRFYAHQTTFAPLEALCAGRADPLRLVTFGPRDHLRQIAERLTPLGCATQVIAEGSYGTAEMTVFSATASKGNALAWLAQRMGVALAETLAIGDGENDVSLLSMAGLGVAMGNALPETRLVADALTASNAEDGVALALERYILEPLGYSGYPADALPVRHVNTV
ncbi:MAG TPA: HAD hydrolase family protein [Ktedonobacterales bacterium]|nr:HAD hydrolase family protein [Ktedonobacterales bacterium]